MTSSASISPSQTLSRATLSSQEPAPVDTRVKVILVEERMMTHGQRHCVSVPRTALGHGLERPVGGLLGAICEDLQASANAAAARGDYDAVANLVGSMPQAAFEAALAAGRIDVLDLDLPTKIGMLKKAVRCVPLNEEQYTRVQALLDVETLWALLRSAALAGRAPVVSALLHHVALPVNRMGPYTSTHMDMTAKASLLFEVVQAGHAEAAQALLEHGADPRLSWEERDIWYPVVPRYRHHSLVGTAVKCGHAEVLEVLLGRVAVAPRKLEGYLAAAEKRGDAAVVQVLSKALEA